MIRPPRRATAEALTKVFQSAARYNIEARHWGVLIASGGFQSQRLGEGGVTLLTRS